jgi:hypothetical protein
MTQYIKKLPAVFQTVTESKFFDATFDQIFSKKDSDLLSGYLGRRNPGDYNPVTDFYLPEPSKNRTRWQLEATAYAKDASSNKTNIFFYEDLLERIEYFGGNTLNQDRLFESEYYSFAPPIDYDMFINYQNYYWVEQGLATITITGVLGADIIGQPSFNTNQVVGATPANLTITTGMTIVLSSDPLYSVPHIVENIGGCTGIRLVPQFPDFTEGTIFEFLPWDSSIELSTGRVIDNIHWDANTWDTQSQPSAGDYITIERGSLDRNAWSRTNKWFHIQAINDTIAATGTSFPQNSTRALRPIIQFIADLNLWKSGTQFRSEIDYGFRNDQFGLPLHVLTFQGQQITTVNAALSTNFIGGELVCFFNDTTSFDLWDLSAWGSPPDMWDAGFALFNEYIFQVEILPSGITNFIPYTAWTTPVLEGDIVFVIEDGPYDAAQRGQTWYYSDGIWQEAFNDKLSTNQAPLFQLYDHNGVKLDDAVTYPKNTFSGNKIFSYKLDTTPGASIDPVLKFAIVYTALGQSSDIVFQNNLITDRYVYSTLSLPITGYYYYKTVNDPVIYNNWNLYQPCQCDIVPPPPVNCLETSKQRVIDQYVVGYGTEFQFKLSVTPYGYPSSPDLIVIVNDAEVKNSTEQIDGYTFATINNELYIDLNVYIASLLSTNPAQPPVVEIQTYTHGLLDPLATGYFQIPQQLEANPTQLEITEISGSNLIEQFSSIIANQIGEIGISFGGNNNYRDTRKNRSLGMYILQNVAPALKSMLVSSSDDLDFIAAERFSQDEYTKFKNKYLRTALQLINQGFNPVQYHNNTIIVSAWVEEILKVVNVSNEFSNAFAYSYMIANGSSFANETAIVPLTGDLVLTNYVDLSDPRNALYIYDTTGGQEELLVIGTDYEFISQNLLIEIKFNSARIGNPIFVAFYKNPIPAYIPSTPSKVGAYATYLPRLEWDTSYTIPTWVIIGHDGSKTIAYGDYRDQLLLELEKRIYNLIEYKFRHQYYLPVRLESVKDGFYRQTRYSRQEYLDITESYLNKWSAKNRANYRANDWYTTSIDPAVIPSFVPGVGNIWKLYNYRNAVNALAVPLNLPGNWKGIFQHYYDTYCPDTRPWEMLGFSQQPSWWEFEYGAPVVNMAGLNVWTATAAGNNNMWQDLEDGIIRQGSSAIYDPVTLLPDAQPMWKRPGLSAIIPVDNAGELLSVMTLFNVAFSGNYYEPFDHFDEEWIYGDGSPVEQAWMSTSAYAFSVQEFLFLMKPAPYAELMWDTVGTTISPGVIIIPGIESPVMSNTNWQYVQNDTFTSDDPFFAWMRPKNKDQIVHAEIINNIPAIRYGYQRWISDRISFLGKNIATTFGQKIRTLDVNLANKLAGFTNKDTSNLYIEAISPNATTNSLILPSTNFQVILHKSPVVDTYSYSGIIIRALADGTFAVYGYDLLNSAFTVLDRSPSVLIDVSVGGTPAPFLYFTPGATYNEGDIVRYNGIYYVSISTHLAQKFISKNYQKLSSLPIIDGISVVYKPVSEESITKIPYGTVLRSAQDVFDLMIGWGAYLESKGWRFDEVNADTNMLSNWLASAKQYLFWLNTSWAPDASIQLSPLANKATLVVSRGYPNDVESLSNGVYSILDKYGIAIAPNNTSTNRDGRMISVEPTTLTAGGIYYLQVNTSETEHVIICDNVTSFNDTVYSPLLRARQQRIRFIGFRSNGWYGKMEAPGYLVIDNQLVPNFDTIVDSMRYFYDPNVVIDNPSLEDLGRHLIGYESKSYLDNLQVSNDVQYLFYQGAIRQKGTVQAFDKLFRSTKIQTDEIIEVFEEWALKLGSFGNTIEQVSTEFVLIPEQNTGEVVVARLNYIPSTIGFVRLINILNAENKYTTVPKIVIAPPDATITDPNLTAPLRQAKAYAILDIDGRISRVDISDPGYGYLTAPYIQIDSGTSSHSLDKLYSVWQGEIIKDSVLDNIINIDIDQTTKWVVRPNDPSYSLQFPVTNKIEYSLPNAGYVNFDDVTWASFDVNQTTIKWGTPSLNPAALDTVWIAKTFTEDWCVYKMVEFNENWSIVDVGGDLVLLTDIGTSIIPEYWNSAIGNRTDFGNMIVMQQVVDGKPVSDNNYTVGFTPYTTTDYNTPGIYIDPTTLISYNAYYLTTLAGVPITSSEIGNYDVFTDLLLYKTMRWFDKPVEPLLPTYVGLGDLIWVDNVAAKWAVFKIQANPGVWDINFWDPTIIDFWSPNYGWDVTGPLYFSLHRLQESLINTSLFESATVFATGGEEVVQLPIYDPFKDILPGPAKQNITYISLQDPASYNVTANEVLFSENITFSSRQVGQLWWDLSAVRYTYYEQPIALDGSETELENLIYRRNNWGRSFPGSTIAIYEWVQSDVPPSKYTGTGIPKDTTTFVQVNTSNRFTSATQTNYYFWVLNATDKPNVENRTMAALDVALLLQSPKSQNFSFFCPIQQTATNNSYMFYNVQEILAYRGNNIQLQYRLTEREDQEHAQWSFFREGDSASIVTDQFWNKLVDSICGYTKVLPVSDEYTGIIVAKNLPWDIYGWDITQFDSATSTNDIVYGEILPVPDPTLSEYEKYGIEYRPRQGMFVSLPNARKVFVQAANDLLKHIPIRDTNPGWNTYVATDIYWAYTTWYEIGYEDATPNVAFQTLLQANLALVSGQLKVGDIVEVSDGTADGRFILYAVIQLNPSVPVLSLNEVGIENSAIKLLDSVYTVTNLYGLSIELRELMNAFRTQVMVNEYFVDQNDLFFSMMNYVVSEQRSPNWLFKTSYIYIKENNLPLSQTKLYIPDQIDNIMAYIMDSKPYHTQIRDYTSTYVTSDIAIGTATDSYKWNLKLQFGPDFAGDTYTVPSYILNAETFADNIEQYVSREDVYTIPLTAPDPVKKGYSELYPYTFTIDDIFLNPAQTFITPSDIVGIQIGTKVLLYGQDYYVEFNNDNTSTSDGTYTVYFYDNPTGGPIPIAIVWFDGGQLLTLTSDKHNCETATGFATDDLVINIDTKLPVNFDGFTYSPISDMWDLDDPVIDGIITAVGGPVGFGNSFWDQDTTSTIQLLENTISFKENTNNEGTNFYRNAQEFEGELVFDLLSPTATTENLDVITVFVDPLTHPITTDILPDANNVAEAIWINGERIEYKMKTLVAANTWELRLIRRGSQGTSAPSHLSGSSVWIEKNNIMPTNSNIDVWNAINQIANPLSESPPLSSQFTNVTSVPLGGLWYAQTQEAIFLKQSQGTSIP